MIAEEPIHTGAKIVGSWLKSHGYNQVHEVNNASHDIEIEADSKSRRICVHIKIVHKSDLKKSVTKQEIENVKTYAATTRRDPWVAILISDGENVGPDISWIDIMKA